MSNLVIPKRLFKHSATAQEAYSEAYELGHDTWPSGRDEISVMAPYFDKKKREKRITNRTSPVTFDLTTFLPLQTSREKIVRAYQQGRAFFGDRRSSDNMFYMSFMSFDVDDNMSVDDAVSIVKSRGLEAVIATSFSHRLAKNGKVADRFRVIVPFSNQLVLPDIEEKHEVDATLFWKSLYGRIGNSLGLPFDPATNDPARLFFYHSCPPDMRDKARSIHIEGRPFDYSPFLGDGILDARRPVVRRPKTRNVESSLDEVRDALSYVEPGAYAEWRDIIFAVHSEFAGTDLDEGALDLLDEWSAEDTRMYDGREPIERIWEAAAEGGGITLATLFGRAIENGYSGQQKKEDSTVKYLKERKRRKFNKDIIEYRRAKNGD